MKLLPLIQHEKADDVIKQLACTITLQSLAMHSGQRIQASRAAVRSILARYIPENRGPPASGSGPGSDLPCTRDEPGTPVRTEFP